MARAKVRASLVQGGYPAHRHGASATGEVAMSTLWLTLKDATDDRWRLDVETGPSGMKLFIIGPDNRGAKFWFKSREQVDQLRETLDWVARDHFRKEPSDPH